MGPHFRLQARWLVPNIEELRLFMRGRDNRMLSSH
jgi:hypothetical protein